MNSFALSTADRLVRGHGVEREYADVSSALSSGAMVMGALAFRDDHPPSLFTPVRFDTSQAPTPPPLSALPAVLSVTAHPGAAEHRALVDRTIVALRAAGPGGLEKVVLARALAIEFAAPPNAADLFARFVGNDPRRNGYLAWLPGGRTLLGSSPELLVRRTGRIVESFPLAGSAPRSQDPAADAAASAGLNRSAKDLAEHRFVVDSIRETLAPYCLELDVPADPQLTSTPTTWHLGTPIRGVLREDGVTALELARALHPTPALCGTPRRAAHDYIAANESDRGFYGGAVGFMTPDGDGEWRVAIRGGVLAGRTFTAHAGGGIVAASDAASELDETTNKLRVALRACGAEAAAEPVAR